MIDVTINGRISKHYRRFNQLFALLFRYPRNAGSINKASQFSHFPRAETEKYDCVSRREPGLFKTSARTAVHLNLFVKAVKRGSIKIGISIEEFIAATRAEGPRGVTAAGKRVERVLERERRRGNKISRV